MKSEKNMTFQRVNTPNLYNVSCKAVEFGSAVIDPTRNIFLCVEHVKNKKAESTLTISVAEGDSYDATDLDAGASTTAFTAISPNLAFPAMTLLRRVLERGISYSTYCEEMKELFDTI